MRHEGHNRFFGDVLTCQACGEILYTVGAYIWFRDIDSAYRKHARKCIGLKKLIILDRRKKKAEAMVEAWKKEFSKIMRYL